MNSKSAIATILAAILVVSVLALYSLQKSPPPIATTVTSMSVLDETSTLTISGSNYTVTVSGGLTTTTVLGQVKMISATGSQAVLCTATSYLVPDTVTSTKSGEVDTITTSTLVNGNSTTIVIGGGGGFMTYITSSVYASATNATNSVGYVVTSTSTDYNVIPSGAWTVMTCTYLP